MNYENASVLSNQNIVLKDRKKLEISGIKKIESLNSEEFLIDTKLGLLFIKGQDLEMQMLDIDKGNIWISGLITVIEYVETLVFSKKFLNNDNIYTKRRIIFNCLFI